jgi:hypothetical protein
VYLREEQRRQAGCSARRMQADFHHGLLGQALPPDEGSDGSKGNAECHTENEA